MEPSTDEANPYRLPSRHFYSVEYPGYVSPMSVPMAIQSLGGQTCIDHTFRRSKRNEDRDNLVDLKFRPENPFSHPVPGDITSTSNLLLKVVKRKRKRLNVLQDTSGEVDCDGEYTAEVVGDIPITVRFRSEFNALIIQHCPSKHLFSLRQGLVDFQYQPDTSDPIYKLRMSMEELDGAWFFR